MKEISKKISPVLLKNASFEVGVQSSAAQRPLEAGTGAAPALFCSHPCHKAIVCDIRGDETSWSWCHPSLIPMRAVPFSVVSPVPSRAQGLQEPLQTQRSAGSLLFPCSLGPPFAKPPSGQPQLLDPGPGCPALRGPAQPGDTARWWLGDSEPGVGVGRAEGCAGACAGSPSWRVPAELGTGGAVLGKQRGWECPATSCSAAALPRQVTRCSGPLHT